MNRSLSIKGPETLPKSYAVLLDNLKNQVRAAQAKAGFSVNRELIRLYWTIGQSIVERQKLKGWGKSVVEHLAKDLHRAFPKMSGFSPRNVWRMRSFFIAYTEQVKKLPRPVAEMDGVNLPRPMADIPWGHNAEILDRLKNPMDRLWYAKQTLKFGWSRNVLTHHIQTKLIQRQGKALTNFHAVLPPAQSDLARQVLKDPYNFDFLTLSPEAEERELESGLVTHLRQFLLELGVGFAFVGQQYHLEVDEEDYYVDLLFYHTRLHSYIVVELKTGPFKPEYAGKMNFYLSAVDSCLKGRGDQPSLGLLLCKTNKKVTVEYALRNIKNPIGVAQWETRLVESLPVNLRKTLPSTIEVERGMAGKI